MKVSSSVVENTICLNMIVRNESKTILRCLNSVIDHIDSWIIVDTGSTDNTRELIIDFFYERKIIGQLYDAEWVNFEHNRNEALIYAKNKADYILLIDADMELIVHDKEWKSKIPFDTCNVKQENNISYYNTRLLKGDFLYQYHGVTHEYIECLQYTTKGKFDLISMLDHGDGGYKSDKFKRDIILLEEAIITDPNNGRYHFYLANSYRDDNQKEKAIEFYKKRIAIGGWQEEVWNSLLHIARCYQYLKDWPNALNFYLQAYSFYPKRSEPLYDLAKYYRENNMPATGYHFAKIGLEIPYPKDDVLFIEKEVYDYLLKYELSICVCYVNKLHQGKQLCDELIFTRSTPKWLRESCQNNLFFYMEKLKYTSIQELTTTKTNPNYHFCNPSILQTKKDLIINLREVSYTFDIEKNFYHYDKTIDTYNHIANATQSSMSTLKQLKDCDIQTHGNFVTGIEDLRLFEHEEKLYAIGTSRTTNISGVNEMIVVHLNSQYQIEKVVRLKGYSDNECQKNWVPITYNDKIHFLYSSDPFILLKPDLETGECNVVERRTPKYNLTNCRGSSQVIKYDNGFLYIVHEIIHKDNRRYYYHRFIYLDSNLEVEKISDPFYFIDKTIEYCAGLALVDNQLWITFGYEDKKAYLIKMDIKNLELKNIL